MKDYELFTIIKPYMDSEEVNAEITKFTEQVTNIDGKILNIDKPGRKRLSYEIQNFKDGYIVIYKLSIEESKVKELKRLLKLNDNILRFMVLTADKVTA